MPPVTSLARVCRVRDLIRDCFAEPITLDDCACEAGLSPWHLLRSFRAAFGETPYQHLMTRRIERAKTLLRRGDLTVTEVCVAVGCTSLGSFSARFTALIGETPSAYRARRHDWAAAVPPCVAKIRTRPVRNGEAGRAAAQ